METIIVSIINIIREPAIQSKASASQTSLLWANYNTTDKQDIYLLTNTKITKYVLKEKNNPQLNKQKVDMHTCN